MALHICAWGKELNTELSLNFKEYVCGERSCQILSTRPGSWSRPARLGRAGLARGLVWVHYSNWARVELGHLDVSVFTLLSYTDSTR